MAGAEFVRADLHVHTFSDDPAAARPSLSEYVRSALDNDVAILGITDHNSIENASAAVRAAEGTALLVLPGVEISTNEGHLLALFAPDHLDGLEDLMSAGTVSLSVDRRTGARRSTRSLIDLVREIDQRGGLAIPAHVDASNGALAAMNSRALAGLLAEPGLAALEFIDASALTTFLTPGDPDDKRKAAWVSREAVANLRDRGLARIMSSDAHSPEKIGRDRASRMLTRLRLGALTFDSVRYALCGAPRARCKAEAVLPPVYPRITTASFEGGFLDGVTLDFSANLNCLIGGRGSGKSTALIAIRAALGAEAEGEDLLQSEDPDDPERMPARTTVSFVDEVGSERVAVRELGGRPIEPASGAPISLELQGLRQEECGALARGYRTDPRALLAFLDQYVDVEPHSAREAELLGILADNGAEVQRTTSAQNAQATLEAKQKKLEAQLDAAKASKLDELAKWAAWLASEGPFLAALRTAVAGLVKAQETPRLIDVTALARRTGMDLSRPDLQKFVAGPTGLADVLAALQMSVAGLRTAERDDLARASAAVDRLIEEWRLHHEALQTRFDLRRQQLESQGLKVEAGALVALARDLETTRKGLGELKERKERHDKARGERAELVRQLHANRENLFERRKVELHRILAKANGASPNMVIHLVFERDGIRDEWKKWLTATFHLRSPRADRVADGITPLELARYILACGEGLLSVVDSQGEGCFTASEVAEYLPSPDAWETIFFLETLRLEDRVSIQLEEVGIGVRREFDHLSQGQQRSILLSFLLLSPSSAPLVLDQPEDHLDAPYIAGALVGHLETAKERRQVILATHSANVTVLGDAELVVPLYANAGRGSARDPGSVDRAETRDRVCELLEGGIEPFKKRAQRYGLRLS